MATTFADHLPSGDHASRPAASAVPAGALYACSDHGLIYQSDGTSTWTTWATLGAEQTASEVAFDPAGDIAATDVQAAVEELDSEKAAAGHAHTNNHDHMTDAQNSMLLAELASDPAAPGSGWKLYAKNDGLYLIAYDGTVYKLTAEEQAAAYEDVVLADSPLVYWRLGESSGTTAVDASGNGRDGTHNGSTLGEPGLIAGDSDTAITLTNSVSRAAESALSTAQWSVEMWFSASTQDLNWLFHRWDSGSTANGIDIACQSNGTIFARNTASGTTKTAVTPDLAWGDGLPHHLVATQDADTLSLYVDGVLQGSEPATAAAQLDKPLHVGSRYDVNGVWHGVLDEFAYYGQALTLEQVQVHYSAGSGA